MLTAIHIEESNLDLKTANAARVSFNKHKETLDDSDTKLIQYLAKHGHWTPFAHNSLTFHFSLSAADALAFLLNKTPGGEVVPHRQNAYLVSGSVYFWYRNYELLPRPERDLVLSTLYSVAPISTAALTGDAPDGSSAIYAAPVTDLFMNKDAIPRSKLQTLTLRMTAPVSIRTQCFKHKFGFVENEVSRRYVKTPPKFFKPRAWHTAPQHSKQGAGERSKFDVLAELFYEYQMGESARVYNCITNDMEIAPEQARFFLPQSMLTTWYWTGTLSAFSRFCQLRLKPSAQYEVRQLAEQVNAICWGRYPLTWNALKG